MTAFLSAQAPLGRLVRLPLRLLPKGSVVPVLAGPGRGAKWIVGSGPHSCWLGFNEWRKRRVFARAVCAGDVVYDIGANVGSYTLLASKLVGESGKVVAFEPVPANVTRLRQHLDLNRCSNVEVVEAAVVDRTGPARFNATADRLLGFVGDTGPLTVRGVALDALLAEGVPVPSCLKIDIEGGETAALQGAAKILSDVRPVVFVATHGAAQHHACVSLLKAARYHVMAVRGAPDELVAARLNVTGGWLRSGDLVPLE